MSSQPPAGGTVPFAWYTDPSILAREQKAIFRRHWQYVGHTGQVAEPGSLATGRAGDVPVLLARDQGGVLRAFLNVCRHRGSQLVDEGTRRATIQCPYHAWTYELDGRLRSAPRSDREVGFDAEALALIPLGLGAWGPFLFVHPDTAAPPLEEALGDLPELVATAGVDVDTLVFRKRSTATYAANWKICCENFLECYHCQVAHPDLVKVIDVSADAYRLSVSGYVSSQFGPVREDWTGDFDPTGSVRGGQFHFIFPNCTLNISPGLPNVSIGPVLPESPETTTRFLDYFFAPDADEEWVEEMLRLDDRVGAEDAVLVERVQRGVRGGVLDGGVLFESERLIAHFDRLVAKALEAPPGLPGHTPDGASASPDR